MKKQTTLILIVGSSGSGKTYMSNYIAQNWQIPQLVSYTTRPMREGEVDGSDHHFIHQDEVPAQDKMLAYTRFGEYEYFTLQSQLDNVKICSYIVDEDGVRFFSERFADQYSIQTIYVSADEGTRRSRGVSQERIDRDNNREKLPDHIYDYHLFNDSDISDFKFHIDEIVSDIINNTCY